MHVITRSIFILLAIIFIFSISGCQTAMSTQYKNLPSNQDISRPFTFESHGFGAHCFDTTGCKVFYANRYIVQDDETVTRPAPKGPDYYADLSGMHIDIANFPPPAEVSWKSRDGMQHEAIVDFGEIFKDQIIRHNVAKEDLPTETIATLDEPEIIMVINNRTIDVYIRALFYLKDTPLRKGASKHEMILSYSKTY